MTAPNHVLASRDLQLISFELLEGEMKAVLWDAELSALPNLYVWSIVLQNVEWIGSRKPRLEKLPISIQPDLETFHAKSSQTLLSL